MILLIDPPFQAFMNYRRFFYPISICSIAGFINDNGLPIKVYDADFNINARSMKRDEQIKAYQKYLDGLDDLNNKVWNKLRTILKTYDPDIVGITVISNKLHSAYATARICKEFNSNIKVVLGGTHPTILPDQVLKHEFIDSVVRGEGEITFFELLKAIENGDIRNVYGLSFKENGKIIHNKNREFIKDLDSLPYNFRELLIDYKKYTPRDMGMIIGSRGCPYNCYFCASKALWHRVVRFRSVKNIIEEVNYVQDKFGTKHFIFEEDNFVVPRKRIIEFCKVLKKEKIDITWEIQARVGSLDRELCEILKKSGCVDFAVGIESGSEKILKDINKGTTLQEAKDTAKILNQTGLPWKAFIVIGFPSETKEDIYKTVKFIEEINPSFTSVHIFTPFPGTELFNQFDIKEEDFKFYEPQSPYNHFCKNIPKDEFQKIVFDVIEKINSLNEKNKERFEQANVWGMDRYE